MNIAQEISQLGISTIEFARLATYNVKRAKFQLANAQAVHKILQWKITNAYHHANLAIFIKINVSNNAVNLV